MLLHPGLQGQRLVAKEEEEDDVEEQVEEGEKKEKTWLCYNN